MKTTQLTFNTNFDKLNAQYIFFKFTSRDKNDKTAWITGNHLDEILDDYHILASVYRPGNKGYIIAKRTSGFDIEALRLKIKNREDFSHIDIKQVPADDKPSDNTIGGADLYQLLFNTTANSQDERYQFNNLNGKLVLLPPFTKKSEVMTAFHLELNQDMVLVAKATTYQTKAYAKKSEKDKAKLAKKLAKPAYHLHLTTFKRDFDNCDDNAYIQAGIPNKKATEPALQISSHIDYLQSRLVILQTAVNKFNRLFNGISSCHWCEKASDKIQAERFHLLNNKSAIAKLAKPLDIRLLDKIGSEDSRILIEDIQKRLESLDISSTINKREIKDACHICLIKPEDEYKTSQEIDPYRQDFRYYRQHVTDELYQNALQKDKAKTLLKNLVKELWIKQAIGQDTIQFIDNTYHLQGSWVFGIIQKKTYHLLELKPNGEYQYYQHDNALLFQHHTYSDEISTIQLFNKPFENNEQSPIELFIISPERDVNLILNQDECVMPDLLVIEAEIVAKEAPLPERYAQSIELIQLFESDSLLKNDKNWKDYKNSLYALDEPISKEKFIETLNKHFHTSTSTNKNIRALLRQHGIILNFSKAEEDLLNKMEDTFTIQAGTSDEKNAWYSVGYYHNSLQHELSHMLHIRKIHALTGNLRHLDSLELMDVDFVRYNNFTVLPFPVKYLREIICLNQSE